MEKAAIDYAIAKGAISVAASGWIGSQLSSAYLGGTSMAAPHVGGIIALMAQVNPALNAPTTEAILMDAAIALPAGERVITDPSGQKLLISWGGDATGAGLITAEAALETMK